MQDGPNFGIAEIQVVGGFVDLFNLHKVVFDDLDVFFGDGGSSIFISLGLSRHGSAPVSSNH